MARKPYVFIGSSSEGLEVAKAIQANLDHTCETHIWSQGLFGLSEGTLETLVNATEKFDFAILALTPDDLTVSRGQEQNSPRDNVLFELGLFIAGLGRDRVFMVLNRSAKTKLPSDLAGITPTSFDPPVSGTLQSALGASCTAIETKIKNTGLRRGQGITAFWWTGCLEDGTIENPDFFMTVTNWSDQEIPWLNVHVFPSNTFRLEPWSSDQSDSFTPDRTYRLMARQNAMYRFRMLDSCGRLEKWARRFLKTNREEVSVRIFKSNSVEEPLLIDYKLGSELYDRIKHYAKVAT